jgi:hypothetical protein
MDPIKMLIEVHIHVHKDGSITEKAWAEKGEKAIEEVPMAHQVNKAKVLVICDRWPIKVGKKEPKTCKGCTIQCNVRRCYKGQEPTEIPEVKFH